MEWSDLRYLLAVARAGTLSAAARHLRVDQTTVTRRLARLQAALGARLFDRIDGALRPTQAAELAIAHAERIETEVDGLAHGIGGSDAVAAGTVRLTAVPIVTNHILVPRLAGLLTRHPGLRVELIAEPRNLDLTRREADLALRLARPIGGTALARRIGQLDYAVYAVRDRPAAALPWIGYADAMSDLPPARWLGRAAGPSGAAAVSANDAEAILAAVRSGLGKSLLPVTIGAAEPNLRRLGSRAPKLSREVWLLVHPELRRLARIAAVIEWLVALFAGPRSPASGKRTSP